jgi:hypothetical protein
MPEFFRFALLLRESPRAILGTQALPSWGGHKDAPCQVGAAHYPWHYCARLHPITILRKRSKVAFAWGALAHRIGNEGCKKFSKIPIFLLDKQVSLN